MDWATIYGITTGSIGTVVSLFLLYRMITTERPSLFPYITTWESITERQGHLIIKLRVVIQNKSKVSNTAENIIIRPRGDKTFCFEPFKFDFLNDGKAHVNYQNSWMEEICNREDVLSLPVNIEGKQSVSGWLGFVVPPEFAEKANKQKWGIKVFDQDGKGYLSTSNRDVTIT